MVHNKRVLLNVVHEYIAHRETLILEVEVSWEHS